MWEKINEKNLIKDGSKNIHNLGSRIVNNVLEESMLRRSLDNITAIFIAFEN